MTKRTNEKAPGAGGNQSEGGDQKPGQDSIWSKDTRRARARAAQPGTVAADHRVAICDSPDRTATVHTTNPTATEPSPRVTRIADGLARLPLVVRRTSMGRHTLVWRTPDGGWWRKGGMIQIRPTDTHGRAFVVTLYKGANVNDVRFLLEMIDKARNGDRLELWDRVTAAWADDQTYMFDSSRMYVDPYVCADGSPLALVCDEPRCVHQWHEYPLHELDSTEGDGYSITVSRYGKERDWHVDVDANGCEFTPTQLGNFVTELQWMRAECEKANAGPSS